jgi:type IV pilus assembly protein PilY1
MGGTLVFFGTGRYVANTDVSDTSTQSFYGIWDNGTATAPTRSDLVKQEILTQTNAHGQSLRTLSNRTVDYAAGKRGWYLDLFNTSSGAREGERVVNTARVINHLVIFTTITPSDDPCEPGGSSWTYALRGDTGGATDQLVFDLNNDGTFDADDTPGGSVINAVRDARLGISNLPVLVEDGQTTTDIYTDRTTTDNRTGYLISSGSAGGFGTNHICLQSGGCTPTTGPVMRRSWIQIR